MSRENLSVALHVLATEAERGAIHVRVCTAAHPALAALGLDAPTLADRLDAEARAAREAIVGADLAQLDLDLAQADARAAGEALIDWFAEARKVLAAAGVVGSPEAQAAAEALRPRLFLRHPSLPTALDAARRLLPYLDDAAPLRTLPAWCALAADLQPLTHRAEAATKARDAAEAVRRAASSQRLEAKHALQDRLRALRGAWKAVLALDIAVPDLAYGLIRQRHGGSDRAETPPEEVEEAARDAALAAIVDAEEDPADDPSLPADDPDLPD